MKMQYNATAPTVVDNNTVDAQSDTRGNLKATLISLNGTAGATVATLGGDGVTAGGIGGVLYTEALGYVFNGASYDRLTKANAVARLLSSAASTNATSVKASAGNVFTIYGVNTNAAARYLKLYNKASAPTVGTDTPVLTLYLPPTAVGGGVFSFKLGEFGQYFGTGIAYALTTAAADSDTGALTSGDVIAMNVTYS